MGIWSYQSLANDWGSDLRLTILDELGFDSEQDLCDKEDCDCGESLYEDWYYSDSCELPTQEHIDIFANTILPQKIIDMEKSSSKNDEAHCIALFVTENKIKITKAMNKKIIVVLYDDNFYSWPEPELRKAVTVKLVNELIALQKS